MNVLSRISVALCVAAILACSWLAPMDAPAMTQVDAGLKRALVTYGTARLLHGAVSVLQGTQVDAAPAGIGLTFAPGQILAPAAEMLKQLSDVMLLVCVSFGIQKLLIAMGGSAGLSLALSAVALGWSWQVLRQRRAPAWLGKLFIVLLMVRFAIALTVLGSDQLFQIFMAQDYQTSQAAISSVSAQPALKAPAAAVPAPAAGAAGSAGTTEAPGLLDKLKGWISQPATQAASRYEDIKTAVERAVEHMVALMVIFVLQTLLLPLLLLWGLYGLARIGLQLPLRPVPSARRSD